MGLNRLPSGFAHPIVGAITPCEGLGVCQKRADLCWNCPTLLKRKRRKTPTRVQVEVSPMVWMVRIITIPRGKKHGETK